MRRFVREERHEEARGRAVVEPNGRETPFGSEPRGAAGVFTMMSADDTFNDRHDDHDPNLDVDVLIGRIADGEASDEDRQRFEMLAASEPTLWRELAQTQQETFALSGELYQATERAAATALPRRWIFPRQVTWPLAASGWAAVIILAATWALRGRTAQVDPTNIAPAEVVEMTFEDHYAQYMDAPYVLGDLPPDVVDVEALSDGRVAVRFVRKTEEIAFLDPKSELPTDEGGALTSDLVRLRASEPKVSTN